MGILGRVHLNLPKYVLALWVLCGLGSAQAAQTDNPNTHTNSVAVTTRGPPPSAVIGLLGDLSFGSLPAGQLAARTLVITNSGNSPLNVWGISCPPAFSGNW